ncbi:hypothetical protein BWI17_03800 [Betaproteobacteria bacterium GR16-43]|nr:hypothetical protein BWI17_03800 [Betaproteobacteria bacterium GR16-43]
MVDILQVTPFLHVPDLAQAVDLFTRVLRFEVKFRARGYAYLEREGAAIRILEEPGRELPELGAKVRITVCIDVRDVDPLYQEMLGELLVLPKGDVHPPMDEPWGQRDFHVRLPDGHWLAFTQPSRSPSQQ